MWLRANNPGPQAIFFPFGCRLRAASNSELCLSLRKRATFVDKIDFDQHSNAVLIAVNP
jgi:hypothetical protein